MSKKSKTKGKKHSSKVIKSLRCDPTINNVVHPIGVAWLALRCKETGLSETALQYAQHAVADAIPVALYAGDETALREALQTPHLNALEVQAYTGMGPVRNVSIVHRLAYTRHVHLLQVLLDHGFFAHAVDGDGATPLHWAARSGNTGMIKAWLAAGADVNKCDRDGCTPVMYAGTDDRVDALHALLSAGADPDMIEGRNGHSALSAAEVQGTHRAAAILRHVTHVQAPMTDPNRRSNPVDSGYTKLHNAAATGDLGFINVLLANGADPFIETTKGLDAMLIALLYGHHEVAGFLATLCHIALLGRGHPLYGAGSAMVKAICDAPDEKLIVSVLGEALPRIIAFYTEELNEMGFNVAPKKPF